MMTVLGIGCLAMAALGLLSREPKRRPLLRGDRVLVVWKR
jgi:hypothetical protein